MVVHSGSIRLRYALEPDVEEPPQRLMNCFLLLPTQNAGRPPEVQRKSYGLLFFGGVGSLLVAYENFFVLWATTRTTGPVDKHQSV